MKTPRFTCPSCGATFASDECNIRPELIGPPECGPYVECPKCTHEFAKTALANLAAVRGQKGATLNLYRTEARVTGMSEPMIDWYEAPTEAAARALFDEDCLRYGVPKAKTTVTIRLATDRERALLQG